MTHVERVMARLRARLATPDDTPYRRDTEALEWPNLRTTLAAINARNQEAPCP